MKTKLSAFMLLISLAVFSQVPTYYNDVNINLTGTSLKDELSTKIISTHTTNLSYTPGVWDALKQTDLDPTDNSKILLIYGWDDTDSNAMTDRSRGVNDNGGSTGNWNREHTYAKSLGNPNLGTSGPGADAHHLRPCDLQNNSSRSNRKFADGSGAASYITSSGYWYPGDEWKGDVARMMMYMYLRYDSQTLPINVAVGTVNSTDSNMIDLLLQWNVDDPVSAFEDQRNPILEGLQGNRNPFIDNPAFATAIWGGAQAEDRFGGGTPDTEAPTAPTNLIASNITTSTVDLSWTPATDNVAVTSYDIYQDAVLIANSSTNSYQVNGLADNTSFSFYVIAKDAANNQSAASNSISATTLENTGGTGTATELLISEYIEGSSYNKALEIGNFTGNTVDLSSYSLKKATNGSGTFSTTLTLSGQLANGQVYVIANSSANSTILNVANITEASITSFNGNDAVGLFKNDVLIDLLGDPSSSSNFAQNTTLQRKSSITSPNTTYTISEWDSFASDTFTGLGSHSIDGGTTDTEAPTAPTNLAAANITTSSVDLSWSASNDNVGVTGYDIYQDAALIASVNTTNHQVTGLADNTSFSFYVIAKDAANNQSAASNSISVTTLEIQDTEAPTAPSSLVASNTTGTTTDLSWSVSTDNVGVTGYDVYQDAALIASVTTTNHQVTGLTNAASYDFYVIAKDAANNQSTASITETVTTLDTESPSTPTSLVAANITTSSIDLSWNAATDNVAVVGYDVYQDSALIASVNTTNHQVTGLADNTSFSFYVIAKDAANNQSSASNSVSATTLEIVNSSTIVSESYFESGWDNWSDGGSDCYRYSGSRSWEGNNSIRIRDNSGTKSAMTSETYDLSSYDEVVVDFYFYSYSMENNEDFWLRYFDGSSWSTVQTWARGTDFENNGFYNATVTLNNSNYTFNSNSQFRFQNDASGNADHIYIDQVVITGFNGSSSRTINEDYKPSDLKNSITLVKYLETDEVEIEVDEDIKESKEFNIYPNPVSGDVLNITYTRTNKEQITYKITTLFGEIVSKGVLSNNTVYVDSLISGMYVIEIFDGEEVIRKKFIKQ